MSKASILVVEDEEDILELVRFNLEREGYLERFYRVHRSRSRKEGGTGLGLSIVKHIAQAHAGRVELESLPGKGSTFSLILPAPGPPA